MSYINGNEFSALYLHIIIIIFYCFFLVFFFCTLFLFFFLSFAPYMYQDVCMSKLCECVWWFRCCHRGEWTLNHFLDMFNTFRFYCRCRTQYITTIVENPAKLARSSNVRWVVKWEKKQIHLKVVYGVLLNEKMRNLNFAKTVFVCNSWLTGEIRMQFRISDSTQNHSQSEMCLLRILCGPSKLAQQRLILRKHIHMEQLTNRFGMGLCCTFNQRLKWNAI